MGERKQATETTKPPISRREALAAGLTAAGLVGVSCAPVPKGKGESGVGETVLS